MLTVFWSSDLMIRCPHVTSPDVPLLKVTAAEVQESEEGASELGWHDTVRCADMLQVLPVKSISVVEAQSKGLSTPTAPSEIAEASHVLHVWLCLKVASVHSLCVHEAPASHTAVRPPGSEEKRADRKFKAKGGGAGKSGNRKSPKSRMIVTRRALSVTNTSSLQARRWYEEESGSQGGGMGEGLTGKPREAHSSCTSCSQQNSSWDRCAFTDGTVHRLLTASLPARVLYAECARWPAADCMLAEAGVVCNYCMWETKPIYQNSAT